MQAGGVEESKFCLFSVVFPVRCISSVSPRFYFRRYAFCFLYLPSWNPVINCLKVLPPYPVTLEVRLQYVNFWENN
jgi:hypothetical protein